MTDAARAKLLELVGGTSESIFRDFSSSSEPRAVLAGE